MRALGPTPDNMINNDIKSELSSLEETRPEFTPGNVAIKLGIDVHQELAFAHSLTVYGHAGWRAVQLSRCRGDFLAEAELGCSGEERVSALKERLHVGSLHVEAGKRLLAVPVLNE